MWTWSNSTKPSTFYTSLLQRRIHSTRKRLCLDVERYIKSKNEQFTRKIYKDLKELPHGYGATVGYSMIMDDVKTVDDAMNEALLDMRNNKEKQKNG